MSKMQSKLVERSTWQEKELYRQHMNTIDNVRPKVDNKAFALNVDAFYKPGVMESNAARLTQIEEENFKLLKNMNIIYRTKGKIDCYKRISLDQRMTGMESLAIKNKKNYEKNLELLNKIVCAKPRIDFDKIKEDQKIHDELIMFLSKRPEYYEKRINSRNVYDPLIVNAGLPPNVQMKKSKCYLDVKDLTVNRRLGRLTIELYDGVVPKTTANFSTLCRRRENELGYKGTQIFRIVPGLFCLAGDVEFSVGIGGVPAEPGQRYFDDENYALGHNAPGTLSMYNFEKNQNTSQFLITFKPLTTLDGRYVVFGRVVRGMNTLKIIEDSGFPSGKPKRKIIIEECGASDCRRPDVTS